MDNVCIKHLSSYTYKVLDKEMYPKEYKSTVVLL